jgi:hypothetical protein
MALPATNALRVAAVVVAGGLASSLLVALPNTADAAKACKIPVTTRLDKSEKFAGKGKAKYYWTHADGSVVGQFDNSANVIMTTFPVGAFPTLINKKIGERSAVGAMTKAQTPTALGSINGDFFIKPDIRYAQDIEMARGPMVKGGQIIRAFHTQQRVVGVDQAGHPFAGLMGVRGNVQARVPADAPKLKVRAINWHQVPSGGVTIYTSDWSSLMSGGKAVTPRPAGTVEWVLSGRNKIKEIRNSTQNTALLGAPVTGDTKVIAFAANVADSASGIQVGTKVRVKTNQSTNTGAVLKTAIGRGLPMIEDGKPGPLGCRAYAKSPSAKASRPRTFVGWDAMGRWRAFIVPGTKVELVNGALSRTGGYGLASAANIAKKLGMTYAYELDGGGSTTLWTRKQSTWTRKDLYGVSNPGGCDCERWVTNGLSFVQH